MFYNIFFAPNIQGCGGQDMYAGLKKKCVQSRDWKTSWEETILEVCIWVGTCY
jgi:hypothetical protein